MTAELYVVIGKGRYYGTLKIVRCTKKAPTLSGEQAAFKLCIEIPSGILNPPVVPIAINSTNLIRPVPKATPQ